MSLLNRKNLVFVLVALVVTFLGANSVQAQNVGKDSNLISVNFKGGTIAEYVDALAEAAGAVNILVSSGAAYASMPAVKLTKVTVSAAVDLTDGYRTNIKTNRLVKIIVNHVSLYAVGENPTFKITAQNQPTGLPRENTRSRIWSIAHLIQDGVFSSKVVLDAIELAIAVTNSKTEVDIRFHEATGLLIVSGSTSQLKAIDNVLDELGRSQQMKSFKSNMKLEQELDQTRVELFRFKNQTKGISENLAVLKDENKALRLELETQMARFIATTRMLNEREGMLRDTTNKFRELQAVLDRAKRQAADDNKPGNKDN